MDQRTSEPQGFDPRGFYPKKYELTEKDLSRKRPAEELREAGYLPRENDWTKTGPLSHLWKLPFPLNVLVLTPVLLGLLVWGMGLIIWESRGRRR